MEHTEFSSMCSSVGDLNKGECFCKGAGELHCAGTPTAVTPPSQLYRSSAWEKTPCPLDSGQGNCKTLAQRATVVLVGWVSREDACVSHPEAGETVFCCSCLQSTQGSASLCRFSPNLCVQGRCPCIELAAREAPSLPYSRAPLEWEVGFCFHFIFCLTFCVWSLKGRLLSCPFAVLRLWVVSS